MGKVNPAQAGQKRSRRHEDAVAACAICHPGRRAIFEPYHGASYITLGTLDRGKHNVWGTTVRLTDSYGCIAGVTDIIMEHSNLIL
jgi:hypothetical protein